MAFSEKPPGRLRKKRFSRAGKPRRKRPQILKIKPGADSSLKSVFGGIGVPGKKEFVPDPFQKEAVEKIAVSDCLVTAPTGSGKTWIAKEAMAAVRQKGGRSWYASPLKALSNSKHIEFSEDFGAENVGILTGDRKENASAPVIVGTTEILRNHLYDAMIQGESLAADLVILDEAHFLGDPERGVVWEEIMIYLPERIPLLLLSATIGNADEIAQWLFSIRRRECFVVRETRRPTPLYPLFMHPGGTLSPLLAPGPSGDETRPGKKLGKKVQRYLKADFPPLMALPRRLPPFGEILDVLEKYRLLPAIFFLKSRADCDAALKLCARGAPAGESARERIAERLPALLEGNPRMEEHGQRRFLERFAAGAHHSGQLPAWKLILEALMTEGLLRAVFATSTVAAGVNFPARTIVFLNSDKFDGTAFFPLTPTEFHQMSGRAGRRGMDKIGFALLLPGVHMDIRHMGRLFSAPPSGIQSRIKINFSMTLNLAHSHSMDGIRTLLDRSLAAWQMSGKGRSKKKKNAGERLWKEFLRHLDFLKKQGYVRKDGSLSPDGEWACRLRVDQPMMIGQCLREGLFPDDNPAFLAALCAVFVNEREFFDGAAARAAPGGLKKAFSNMAKELEPFREHMEDNRFLARPLFFTPAVIIYLWASGFSWESVLEISGLAEGDLAMLIFRTADNLRHIQALGDFFPDISQKAGAVAQSMLRDPVA
ncbi:ATP-dependent DNA helicase [Candidatus Desulfarcum epimagneticum]|uniref:ATP-dependent DNA helicase n=1 Tax=uncultured Desulfobacteraceae bacterium TaxID=218296 RepID=A0A484HD18_9BACT|nr:ATP-dependent DNA helicase [uncultured Desulfobacteraceae bacterium]